VATEAGTRSGNTANGCTAKKQTLTLGTTAASHEFDLYEASTLVGGINTSPWFNKSGSYNTGGQDRAATELLCALLSDLRGIANGLPKG
jgi:hypothetical protein